MSTTARLLTCLATLLLVTAEAPPAPPLNPTVAVLANPIGTTPSDCATGQVVAAPRLPLDDASGASLPAVASYEAPPQTTLQAALRRVQIAAERNDRDAFVTALRSAKSVIAAYPPGGEKSAAESTLHVYDDLDRLWDYSYSSPTGAFFESGALLNMLHAYPGYEAAIADNKVVTGDRTLYPAVESRAFLVAEAGRHVRGGRTSSSTAKRQVLRKVPNTREVAPPKQAVSSGHARPGVTHYESHGTAAAVEPAEPAHRPARQPSHRPARKKEPSASEASSKPATEKATHGSVSKPAPAAKATVASSQAVKPGSVKPPTSKPPTSKPGVPAPVPSAAVTPAPSATPVPPPAPPARPAPPPAATTATTTTSPATPAGSSGSLAPGTTAPASTSPPAAPATDTALTAATSSTTTAATMTTATDTTATETKATDTTATVATTDTAVGETTGSGTTPAKGEGAGQGSAKGEGAGQGSAKLIIAVLLIVAALAFLVYLFRSGD